jgi:hypothetical protein
LGEPGEVQDGEDGAVGCADDGDGLKPSELANTLPSDKPISIAIVGASHSAILAILNLARWA